MLSLAAGRSAWTSNASALSWQISRSLSDSSRLARLPCSVHSLEIFSQKHFLTADAQGGLCKGEGRRTYVAPGPVRRFISSWKAGSVIEHEMGPPRSLPLVPTRTDSCPRLRGSSCRGRTSLAAEMLAMVGVKGGVGRRRKEGGPLF